MNRKFERQLRLKEVGPLGQARIDAARVNIHVTGNDAPSLEQWVVKQYLQRAGVTQIETSGAPDYVIGTQPDDDGASQVFDFKYEAALEIGRGAFRALRLVRKILE